jgi:hypothetical protein
VVGPCFCVAGLPNSVSASFALMKLHAANFAASGSVLAAGASARFPTPSVSRLVPPHDTIIISAAAMSAIRMRELQSQAGKPAANARYHVARLRVAAGAGPARLSSADCRARGAATEN